MFKISIQMIIVKFLNTTSEFGSKNVTIAVFELELELLFFERELHLLQRKEGFGNGSRIRD